MWLIVNFLLRELPRTSNTLASWNHSGLSTAGRVILINSSLLPILVHMMYFYGVLDTILDKISKMARSFLWNRISSSSGLHSVGWDTITLDQSEGGLSIRNLSHFKIVFMSKNVFPELNDDKKLWVLIFQLNYGSFNLWDFKRIAKSSWVYKSFCKIAAFIKNNLWLDNCNSSSIDFWRDPWCFDLPFSLKPTLINMHGPLDDISFSDLLNGSSLSYNAIIALFGNKISWPRLSKLSCSDAEPNHCVWMPASSKSKLVSIVYHHLNQDRSQDGN